VKRGPNYERNLVWRKERKERKLKNQKMGKDWRKRGSSVCASQVGGADASWVVRKNAENELKAEQARRALEVLKNTDIDTEVRRHRARVLAQTEKSKVSIETSYRALLKDGNVASSPGGGLGESTVSSGVIDGVPGLSPGAGSISPDSSASMREFMLAQKRVFDLEAEVAAYKRKEKRSKDERDLDEGQLVVFSTHENESMFVTPSVKEMVVRVCGGVENFDHGVDSRVMGGTWFQKCRDDEDGY